MTPEERHEISKRLMIGTDELPLEWKRLAWEYSTFHPFMCQRFATPEACEEWLKECERLEAKIDI